MKIKLLTSVAAAALMFAAGAASAQGMKDQGTPGASRAPAAQQNAPAEKMAPSTKAGENKAGEHKSTTGEATSEKAPHNAQNKGSKSSTTGAASEEKSEMKGKSASEKNEKSEMKNEKSEMKGKSTTGANEKANEKSNATNEKSNVNEKSTTRSGNKMEEHNRNAGTTERNERSTVSQGSASGLNKLSTEQRTKITTIFHEHKVAPAHLNISIRVGERVPSSVHLYPVPTEIVEVYPEWRGFYYIYVGDQILVISPRTHEIVAVLEA